MTSIVLNGAGAIVSTALVVAAASLTANAIFRNEAPSTPGYEIALPDASGATETAVAAEEAAPKTLAELLASADLSAGQVAFRKCAICHDAAADGRNKVGPNLYGVIGRPIASIEGFAYSDAMKSHGGGAETWTFEGLNEYITNPRTAIPGNKMAFVGLRSDVERANLLAWLNGQSDEPAPLP